MPKWDLAGMAQVRAAVDVLIEADEAAYTPHDVVQIIRAQAADVINIKIAKAGGLYQSKKIAAVAEAAGLECVIGTAWGLGIKVAAKLHLAAATRSLRDGVEFTELMLHDLLLADPQAADLRASPERRLPQRPARPRSRRHPRRGQDPHPRTPQAPLIPAAYAQWFRTALLLVTVGTPQRRHHSAVFRPIEGDVQRPKHGEGVLVLDPELIAYIGQLDLPPGLRGTLLVGHDDGAVNRTRSSSG